MTQNGDGSEVEMTVWLDDEHAERLIALAAALGRTPEEVLRDAVRAFTEKEPDEDD